MRLRHKTQQIRTPHQATPHQPGGIKEATALQQERVNAVLNTVSHAAAVLAPPTCPSTLPWCVRRLRMSPCGGRYFVTQRHTRGCQQVCLIKADLRERVAARAQTPRKQPFASSPKNVETQQGDCMPPGG